ncbi:MAG: hypothetical protein ACI87E_002322 [Mariniblastus sp.]|jgi:hypothetical protein
MQLILLSLQLIFCESVAKFPDGIEPVPSTSAAPEPGTFRNQLGTLSDFIAQRSQNDLRSFQLLTPQASNP